MLKLISLEVKKFKLYHYWQGVVIANLLIIALVFMIFFLERNDGIVAYENFDMAMLLVNSMIRATFLIFSSVILVKIVIDEYKDGSINLMFTYPISRKKIMTAKLAIIVCFTFVTIMFSSLLIGGVVYFADELFDMIPGEIGREDILENMMGIFLGAVASAGLSLIPLYFGLRKKSAAATIVSAIVLVSLTNSTTNDFTLFSFIAIPISLGIVGLAIAYLTIRKIEYKDV